jgi:hypothetical protein
MTSAMAEVIEAYAETGKLLVRKWRDYGSEVATGLESGYDTESASEYLGTATSLTIETWARLTLKTLEAIEILNAGLDEPRIAWSKELTSPYKGATLKMQGGFKDAFEKPLAGAKVTFKPEQLSSQETKFRVGLDVTTAARTKYTGTVVAMSRSGKSTKPITFDIDYS